MAIVGDVELLLRQTIVTLPNLEALAVGAEVGAKVDAVFRIGKIVGGGTDLGASGVVDPLLERVEGEVLGETYVAVEREGVATSIIVQAAHIATRTATHIPTLCPLPKAPLLTCKHRSTPSSTHLICRGSSEGGGGGGGGGGGVLPSTMLNVCRDGLPPVASESKQACVMMPLRPEERQAFPPTTARCLSSGHQDMSGTFGKAVKVESIPV